VLKDLLSLFGDKPRTMTELSSVLGLDKDEVQERLDQMVRMGYLEEMKDTSAADQTVKKHCLGCGGCKKSSCHSTGRSYRLTEKGNKVV